MKILLVILPLVSGPIIIVGWFSVQASADRVNRLVRQEQRLLLEAAAERINRHLEQTRFDLETLASLPVLEDFFLARSFRLAAEEEFHRENIGRIFRDFLKRTPAYRRLTCLDDQARPLVTVGRNEDQSDPPTLSAETLEAVIALGPDGVHISDLIPNASRAGFSIYAARAYFSGLKQPAGAVVISLDFDRIVGIVRSIRVGEEGYAFLLDHKGRNIVHPTFAPYQIGPDRLPDPSLQPLFAAMVSGRSGWKSYHFEGVDKEAAFAPIPVLGWSLAVTVPMVALHQEALAVRSRVIQVVILTVVLTLTGVSVLSYHLLRPVRRLAQATERIAAGDLDHTIPVQSHDELGELTAAFNQMVRTLARTQNELVQSAKLISLGRLSAGVAHEIRNPLNAMKAAMVHLKRRRSEDPLIVEYSELVSEEIDRLNRFVTEFLFFAKQAPPRKIRTDLNAIILGVHQLFKEKARQSEIAFHLRLDSSLPALLIDPDQMEQVLVNLVVNAVEAMPQGGAITITSTLIRTADRDSSGDLVQVAVYDTGPGIPPEHLGNIFDPFFTTKEAGTGLGLPLSLGIVESHGGRLSLENQTGQGAAAFLELPGEPAGELEHDT